MSIVVRGRAKWCDIESVLFGSPEAVHDNLHNIVEALPEGSQDIHFEYKITWDNAALTLHYSSPESDQEQKARLGTLIKPKKRNVKQKADKEQREIKELARLTKKYGSVEQRD